MTTGCPSTVRRTSSSTASAPRSAASRNAARVFSGAAEEAPRCAITRQRSDSSHLFILALQRVLFPSLRGAKRRSNLLQEGDRHAPTGLAMTDHLLSPENIILRPAPPVAPPYRWQSGPARPGALPGES